MPVKQVKSKLFDDLVKGLVERAKLDQTKKDATNAFNRENNRCGKMFAAFYQEQNLPARTVINIDGTEYMWAVSEGRAIDPRQWYKLWQDGEITDDQYFSCLSVGKRDASLIVGEDQVETLSINVKGTDADIRTNRDGAGTVKGIRVITPAPIHKPSGIRARVLPKPVQASAPQRRKIVIGKK